MTDSPLTSWRATRSAGCQPTSYRQVASIRHQYISFRHDGAGPPSHEGGGISAERHLQLPAEPSRLWRASSRSRSTSQPLSRRWLSNRTRIAPRSVAKAATAESSTSTSCSNGQRPQTDAPKRSRISFLYPGQGDDLHDQEIECRRQNRQAIPDYVGDRIILGATTGHPAILVSGSAGCRLCLSAERQFGAVLVALIGSHSEAAPGQHRGRSQELRMGRRSQSPRQ
jgi:hypothetical protein